MQPVFMLAFGLGLMLSPDTFIVLGNTVGSSGLIWCLGSLLLAGALHGYTVRTYGTLGLYDAAPRNEARVLQDTVGPVWTTVLPLCARIVYLVCAATGLLAIAGYVFNEVFVRWFPNLGFSFALLGCVLLLTLLPGRLAAWLQALAIAGVLGGILWLVGTALSGVGSAPASPWPRPAPDATQIVQSVLAVPLVLLGIEFALFVPAHRTDQRLLSGKLLALGLLLACVLLGIWGYTSLGAVAPATLADSTVPHMVTARAILGETGRKVMGGVVLAGTYAAVQALLAGGARMLQGMSRQGLLPAWLGRWQARPALLLLAAGPAGMMGIGMAGEPETEVYTRAGALCWMLHYAVLHLAVLRRGQRWQQRGMTVACAGLSACLYIGSVLAWLWLDHARGHLLVFMALVSGSVACLSVGWRWYSQQQAR
ncbi:MAG: hypothetical protein FJZ47_13800 [Candidatus Tectomicrobia bacterium]|uniref:Amino acid permease n=1 Tax=Tectimicrobiota bacterium TaxID=2528274 RepID=A0A937W4A4_UNCTE|nr:hypothetical protein [Candidatus Tectomicrobia bacterium]